MQAIHFTNKKIKEIIKNAYTKQTQQLNLGINSISEHLNNMYGV